jgi:hypothetical protein
MTKIAHRPELSQSPPLRLFKPDPGGVSLAGWSVLPRRRLSPAGNGPTGDMEARKGLGPSVPGTGVTRDSETRYPRLGGPRLGCGARTARDGDGGLCWRSKGVGQNGAQ